jgi:hypothetical protein
MRFPKLLAQDVKKFRKVSGTKLPVARIASRWLTPGSLGIAQTMTSTSRTSSFFSDSSTAARYSRIASWMFSRASSSVAPCDQQPGSPGQETLKPSSLF